MTDVFLKLLNISFSASLLIVACIVIRYAVKGLPKYMRCILWLLVLVRLVCPIHLESPFSLQPRKDIISFSSADQNEYVMVNEPSAEESEAQYYFEMNAPEKSAEPTAVTVTPSKNPSYHINKADILMMLSVIWIIGIAAALGYGIISYIRLAGCVKDAVLLKGNVYQSERVSTAFVLGLFRTRIYVPYNLSATELYFVLSHERAHIARKDHMLKPVAYVISCIYWFNPLVWISYSLLCRDIELACDEKALGRIGYNKKKEYSQSILDLSIPRKYISACPVAFGETGVKERVKSVLNMKKSTKIITAIGAVIIVITGIGFLTYPKTEKTDDKQVPEVTEAAEVITEESSTAAAVAEDETVDVKAEDDTADWDVKTVTADDETEAYLREMQVEYGEDGTTKKFVIIDGSNKADVTVLNSDTDDPAVLEVSYEGDPTTEGSAHSVKIYINDKEVTSEELEKTIKVLRAKDMTDDNLDLNLDDADIIYVINGDGIPKGLTEIVDSESAFIARPYSPDHQGIDIVAEEGSSILSVTAGTVKSCGSDADKGNYIVIRSDDGEEFTYAHLKELPELKEGDKVVEGQVIGALGNTGKSTGPHLHFSVLDSDGNTKNAGLYLAEYYYDGD